MRLAAKWIWPVLLALVLLAPVWTFPYLPLVDYPNHLARAFILAHLDDPSYAFQRFYAADWGFYPYLTMDITLVVLQRLVSVEAAGRILLSLSLLAVPLGVWFFLRHANPGQDALVMWSLLIAYNHFLLTGLINLELSVGLCFLALGLWLRFLGTPSPIRWLLVLLALTGLYFTHLVGFAVAAVTVGVVSLRERCYSWNRKVLAALTLLPGIVLLALWRAPFQDGTILAFPSFSARLVAPLLLVENYFPRLDLITVLLLLGCLFLACWRNPEFRWNHRWLEVCVVLAALYLTLPVIYGRATFVYQRLAPFLFLAALAAIHVGRRARWLAPIVGLLFVVRMAALTAAFASQQPMLAGLYESLDHTPRHARVLPLVAWKGDSQAHKSYSQVWAYGVIQKEWYCPYLFHDPGVHPLRLRYQPYVPSAPFNLPTDYSEAPQWSRIQQDYDFVWAFHVPQFEGQLAQVGTLVYGSGDLKLYRLHRGGE